MTSRLLIRPGGIGDFIASLPAMECLRADYCEVWSLERNLPLVRFADRVGSYVATGLDLAGIADPPRSLFERLRGFDSVVSWYGANRPEFREALSGFPVTFFPALPPPGWRTPASEFYLEQVRTLAPCRSDGIPRIACDAPRENRAVIQPFSGSPKKNWPLERFARLAGGLPLPVRWCAGPDETLAGAVRIADLYELACWLAGARIYIGNDSGISHLAAAVGVPVVAIFGPTDPAVWAPRGPAVRVISAPGGELAALDTGAVERVVRDMLESRCV